MSQQPLTFAKTAFGTMSWATVIRQNLVWLGLTLVAILSAPGTRSGWVVFWLIVAALLVAASLTGIHVARAIDEPRMALIPLAVAGGSALAAVIISLMVRPISGLFLIIILAMLVYTGKQRPFVTSALSVILAPWWVWLALHQWQWQLILLVPLIGLALIATSHLLDAHAWPEDSEPIMSGRAHRWAAWLLIALSGLMLVLVGLMADVDRPLLALAGIVLALSIPMEAGFGSNGNHSARQSVQVVAGAYLVAVTCWLVGIA